MMSRLAADRRIVAGVVVVWAALTWGTRIGLLTDAEAADPVTWLRVGGSLATAALAAGGLLSGRSRWGLPAVLPYALWAVGTWATSLVAVWADPHPLSFRLVHTALAATSWMVAVAAMRVVGQSPAAVRTPRAVR